MSPVQCVTDVPVPSSVRKAWFLALRDAQKDALAVIAVGVAGRGPLRFSLACRSISCLFRGAEGYFSFSGNESCFPPVSAFASAKFPYKRETLLMKTYLVAAICLGTLTPVPPAQSQAGRDLKGIVFRDISVIPMDTERVVPHQTVIVLDGKIIQMGPADSVRVPPGSAVIEGRGKFLAPGLADMHTHIDRKEMLPLFLAAGVTTVLNMGLASPEFVTLTRDQIKQGSVVGPRVLIAFMIDGPGDPGPEYVALCERDAREAVDRAKLVGYDFIKAYSRLDANVYAAVMDEARKQQIAVVGHIPTQVGLESSLDQGQVMIAHGEEYYKTYFQNKPDDCTGCRTHTQRRRLRYAEPVLLRYSHRVAVEPTSVRQAHG